jgi:hypothetical protein
VTRQRISEHTKSCVIEVAHALEAAWLCQHVPDRIVDVIRTEIEHKLEPDTVTLES